ncbi:MAG: response regulator [bacterium]|nr:response regulator [bacterium]
MARKLPHNLGINDLLPDMDGLTACSQIRSESRRPKIDIIVVFAGDPIMENAERLSSIGRITALRKPFDLEELRRAILKSLGKGGQR